MLETALSASGGFLYRGLHYEINEDDTTTVRVVQSLTKITFDDEVEGSVTLNYKNLYGKDVIVPRNASHNGAWYKVTRIGEKAFYGVGIKSISLPDRLEEIGDDAFSYDPEGWYYHDAKTPYQNTIDTIAFPSSLQRIGKDAFLYTTIKKLSVPSIGWWCNLDCRSSFPDGYDLYAGGEYVEDLVIPEGVESIHDYCFKGCTNILKSVDLPNSLKHIGISAFDGLGIEKVNIHSLESWCGIDFSSAIASNYDLYLNDELIEVLIVPEGVESISDYCFSGCKSIKSIDLPNSLKSVGLSAFNSCNISKILTPSLDSWLHMDCMSSFPEGYMLYINNELIEDFIIPEGVESIRDYCFAGCKSIKSVHLPNSVRTLGESVFKDCVNLTSVNLSDNIKTVNQYCFGNCIALESIKLPCAIERIEKYAFSGCDSLTSVVLPDSLRYLSGFDSCTKLERIDIPERVDTIGDYAFNYSTNLKTIVSYIRNGENTVFSKNEPFNRFHPDCYLTCRVYVPRGCKASYVSSQSPWHSFYKITPLQRFDINADLKVDVVDLTILINAILNGVAYKHIYDINQDGEIDIRDVTLGIHDVLNDVAVVPK